MRKHLLFRRYHVVTHVFISDSTRGYAVSIQDMLRTPLFHALKVYADFTTPLLRRGAKDDKLYIRFIIPVFSTIINYKGVLVIMLKIIMGLKGSGKTKILVGLVCTAVNEGKGDVIVIEKERKLTYDIPYQARLIDAGSYDIGTYEFFKGFISGIHAGNYDITHFFIDNFYKLVKDKDEEAAVAFLQWLAAYSDRENIEFVVSMSSDREKCPEALKPYLI